MSNGSARDGLLTVALVAVLVVLAAQVALVLFPILYVIGEDWDYLASGLVAVGLYAAPLLAGLTARLRRGAAVRLGAVACVAALVMVAAVRPVSLAVAIAGTALVLVGGTTMLAHLSRGGVRSRSRLVSGLVLGLAVHTCLLSPWQGWPLPWQGRSAAPVLEVALGMALLLLAWSESRREEPAAASSAADGGGRRGGGLVFAAGPFLALQLLFLQNPAFVASQAGRGPTTGVLVVLCSDLLAAPVVAVMAAGRRPSRPALALGTGTAVVVAVALARTEGPAVLPLVAALQVLLTGGLAALAERGEGGIHDRGARTRTGDVWPTAAAAGLTGVTFLALVLAWQLDIVRPLPFPRAVVPGLAAAAAGIPAVLGAPTRAARTAQHRRPSALVAAGLLVLSLAVPAAIRLSRPPLLPRPTREGTVRLVSWNIRSAVGVGGQLRPDRIAEEIRSSDPDVVVLQEVSRGTPISDATDILAYLQWRLDMRSLFAPAADGQFGNAVLSRLPMSLVSTGPLPSDGGQRRSALAVRIDVAGRGLVVVDAHTGSRSARQIAAVRAAARGASPAVLAGDFNVTPTEPEAAGFAGLVDVVAATGDRCRTTSSAPVRPCDRPDWVLLTPDLAVVDVRIATTPASDHLPLHVTVRLPPA